MPVGERQQDRRLTEEKHEPSEEEAPSPERQPSGPRDHDGEEYERRQDEELRHRLLDVLFCRRLLVAGRHPVCNTVGERRQDSVHAQ